MMFGIRTCAVAIVLILVPLVGCSAPPEPHNLVFISLDTVRRDHLPTYGYPRPTAPAIDALAAESVVFDNAYAQETNTNPSHTSMLTGLYPHTHGNVGNRWVLREGQQTMAGVLSEAGFRTAAFVSGIVMSKRLTGLERGFEVYDDELPSDRRDGRDTTRRALEWLAERGAEERFFLFLHLYDAHGPYTPDATYATEFVSEDPGPLLETVPRYQQVRDAEGNLLREANGYVDRYDRQIRYLDDRVAQVLASIDLDRTIVVVLSDHGETLLERYHKLDHGAQAFDEQIRIPLIVRAPGIAPARLTSFVETVDLMPTLLELLHVQPTLDPPMQGRSLVPAMLSEPTEPKRHIFSACRANQLRHADRKLQLDPRRRIVTIRTDRWKVIRYPGVAGSDPIELYDVQEDPGETRNVARHHQKEIYELLDEMNAWLQLATDRLGSPQPLDPETLEKLRSLGYVR